MEHILVNRHGVPIGYLLIGNGQREHVLADPIANGHIEEDCWCDAETDWTESVTKHWSDPETETLLSLAEIPPKTA